MKQSDKTTDLLWKNGVLMQAVRHKVIGHEWTTWEPVSTFETNGDTGNIAPSSLAAPGSVLSATPTPPAPTPPIVASDEQLTLLCDLCAAIKSIDYGVATSADYMRINALGMRAMATFPPELWERVCDVYADPLRESLFALVDDLRIKRGLPALPKNRQFWSAPGIANPNNVAQMEANPPPVDAEADRWAEVAVVEREIRLTEFAHAGELREWVRRLQWALKPRNERKRVND